jgi:hypothetical protein
VPLGSPSPPTTIDVALAADRDRAIHVASSDNWLRARIENPKDQQPFLHLNVLPELVPPGVHAGTVRIAYDENDAISNFTVAVER